MKYILGILNSKMVYYWLYWLGTRKGKALNLYLEPLQFVPIKRVSKEKQEIIIEIVDLILNNINPSQNYDELNKRIYELYELTPHEIEIIENQFPNIN